MGVAAGSLVALIFRVAETFLWAVMGILTARLLSVSDRGVYATAIVATTAVGSISSLSASTGYFVANRQRKAAEVAGNSIVMVGPLALALLLVGLGLWLAAGSENSRIVAFAVLSLAPQVIRNSTVGVMLAENKLVQFNIASDITVILGASFIAIWVGVLDHRTAMGALEAWCAAQYCSMLPLLFWGRSWIAWIFTHRPDGRLMKSMLTFTGVTGFGSIIGLLHGRTDQILIIRLDGQEAAGIYSSAIAVAALMLLFSGSVTTAAFARVGAGSRQEAARVTATAVRHTVLVVVGGGLVAAAMGPFLIETMFGRAYGEAATPLRILCLGTAIHAPQGLINLYFINQLGRPQIAVLISVVAFAVSVVAALVLIPAMGPAGAAWSTTISYALATAAAVVIFLRRTDVPASELWRVRASDIAAYFELALSVLVEARKLVRRAFRQEPSPP